MSTSQQPSQEQPMDWSNFKPPGPGDSRSPCPALNVLANYGFLPHDGKNITKAQFIQATMAVYNLDIHIAELFANGAMSVKGNHDPTINLEDLGIHGVLEHDSSLSREDAAFGDCVHFSPEMWSETVQRYRDGIKSQTQVQVENEANPANQEQEMTNWALASKVRYARLIESKTRHEKAGKTWKYGAREAITSYGETALYLSVLGKDGKARLDWVEMFFEQERLPYDQGWRPPAQISQATFNHAYYEMVENHEHAVQEVEIVSMGTLRALTTGLLTGLHLIKGSKKETPDM